MKVPLAFICTFPPNVGTVTEMTASACGCPSGSTSLSRTLPLTVTESTPEGERVGLSLTGTADVSGSGRLAVLRFGVNGSDLPNLIELVDKYALV